MPTRNTAIEKSYYMNYRNDPAANTAIGNVAKEWYSMAELAEKTHKDPQSGSIMLIGLQCGSLSVRGRTGLRRAARPARTAYRCGP